MLEPWHQDTQENFIVPVQRISFGKRPPRNVKGPSSDQVNHPRTSKLPICVLGSDSTRAKGASEMEMHFIYRYYNLTCYVKSCLIKAFYLRQTINWAIKENIYAILQPTPLFRVKLTSFPRLDYYRLWHRQTPSGVFLNTYFSMLGLEDSSSFPSQMLRFGFKTVVIIRSSVGTLTVEVKLGSGAF